MLDRCWIVFPFRYGYFTSIFPPSASEIWGRVRPKRCKPFFLLILQCRAFFKGSKNSLMVSRYMILSGTVILSFLALHFYDFWIPEMEYKYIQFKPDDPNRYHHELVEKFQDPVKVGFYCISFIFLALHLVHGLASSTQSLGTSNKYSSLIKKISYSFGIVVPLGFCFIAIYHFLSH